VINNKNTKIYVAGHSGMVGSAIVRYLQANGFNNIVTRTHSELDLTNQNAVQQFFQEERPDQVYLAAAKVGGIYANNTYPAEFIYQNLMIEANVIHQAFGVGVKKLIFLGSSCIYPKMAPQPMIEDMLLSGKLEPTNEPYAIAKIAGIKLCESYNRQYGQSFGVDYRSVMPSNLYGPGDNYHAENSHVIPALIRRFHEAKISHASEVVIWGSGNPMREFLYVDDLAAALVFVMSLNKSVCDQYTKSLQGHINVGYGSDISIKDLSAMIARIVGYVGETKFDTNMPDGPTKKLVNSGLLNQLGWSAKVSLEEGLNLTYSDFLLRDI
jgi:GDP-L-fucose synthase